MSETTPKNTAGQEVPNSQSNEEIRTKLLADGVPEEEITPELIAERAEIEGKLDDTAMISGETVAAWRRRLLEEAERADTQTDSVVEAATTAASEAAGDAIDAARDAASSAVKNADEKAAEYIGEKADSWFQGLFKDIPGVSGFLENFSIGEHVQKFVASMLGGFGLGSFFSGLMNKILGREEDPEDNPQEDPVETGGGDDTPEPEDPPSPEPAEDPIASGGEDVAPEGNEILTLDRKRFAYYKSGATLLISLNGRIENRIADNTDFYTSARGMSYSDLIVLSQSDSLLGKNIDDGEKEFGDEALTKLKSEETITLLRVGLSKNSIGNIINPNGALNTRLFPYFGDTPEEGRSRVQEILEMSQEGGQDWWKELTFSEISMLYISSIPALRIPAFNAMGDTLNSVRTFFSEEVLSTDIEEMSVLPRSLLERFAAHHNALTTNRRMQDTSSAGLFNDLYEEGENPNDSEKEAIEDIFLMKQYLIGDFINEEKIGMNSTQKELFIANLDYTGVIAIYSILGGARNVEDINPISLPILLYTVSKIIGSTSLSASYQGSIYLGSYISSALFSSTESPLSPEELEILKIYGSSAFDLMLYAHLDRIADTMGIPSGALGVNLTQLGGGIFAGGLAGNMIGRRMIRKQLERGNISIGGTALRRLGLLGMFAGTITVSTGFLLEENHMGVFAERLDTAIGNQDLAEFQRILELHKNSVKTFSFPDGREMSISAFPGETPFVVMDGKLFTINVGDADLPDTLKGVWNDVWNGDFGSIAGALGRLAGMEATGNIDGVNFNIQRYESGNIIFGEGESTYSIPLNSLLDIQASNPGVIGQDIVNRLTDGEYTIPWVGSEGEKGYVINKLGDSHVLFLREIGEIQTS